jgi:hypothetical protein
LDYGPFADHELPDEPVGVGVVGKGGSCVGTLAQVADALGFSCPKTICAAQVLASNCQALPGDTLKTTTVGCWKGVSFEISPTRRKACYYQSQERRREDQLVSAEVWDDEARFCGGRATHLSAGPIPECLEPLVTILCDLAHPEQSQLTTGMPPRACFNGLLNSCEVCCPDATPDCSHNPDGYPGSECTPAAPHNLWTCDCRAGRWDCPGLR